mmetsp:Transcript_71336/g.157543  ORF Transcript_71336/g.157543 Transcript_71336/m.157543 type:complete len:209 (-) Transcript_71336:306-932(-)
MDGRRHHRSKDGRTCHTCRPCRPGALQTTMTSTVQPIMVSTFIDPRIFDDPGEPGVLATAGHANMGFWAFRLGPMHIGLWVEAKHIAGPQLLLSLGSPSLLPSKVSTHGRHMRVVLGGDRSALPAVPTSDAGPGRGARVGHQHALAHDAFHNAAGQQDRPAQDGHEEQGADVVPWRHIHIDHGILANDVLISIDLLLLQLRFGLGWSH